MQKHLFLQIVEVLGNHAEYFQLRYDATENCGLMPLTNCSVAMQMLTYGMTTDCVDECKHRRTSMHEQVLFSHHTIIWGRILEKSKSNRC